MKLTVLYSFILFSVVSCKTTAYKNSTEKGSAFISKTKYKKNEIEIDTLWVSQNDTTVFKSEVAMIHRPCSKPTFEVRYELIKPINEAYYFIYNKNNQLQIEGKYTIEYTYEGQTQKIGNFYNSKRYFYKSNGNLKSIHYMNDGRSSKTELVDRKKRVTEITYFDKKSANKTKVEKYAKGQLKTIRIYTSFNNYYTVKADRKAQQPN